MSTTYTPDPTATQAPAAAPDPDNFPSETLPAAGDGDTAASVAQAFKVLGDYIAWLKAPRSKASAWTQRLRTYLNARLQRRFAIDHEGMPGGNIIAYDEYWDRTAAGLFGADLGWLSTPGSGSILPGAPNPTAPGGPAFGYVSLSPAMNVLGVPAATYLRRTNGLLAPHANLVASVAYPLNLETVGTNHVLVVHGLVSHNSTPDTIGGGARFRKDSADANWKCELNGIAAVDSGVPPVVNTYQRFKIVALGSGTSDDSAARVLFFIDDVQVANIAGLIAVTAFDRLVPFFGMKGDNSASPGVVANVGPFRYRQNMFQTV